MSLAHLQLSHSMEVPAMTCRIQADAIATRSSIPRVLDPVVESPSPVRAAPSDDPVSAREVRGPDPEEAGARDLPHA
jgi:hypothetical protein